MSWWHVSDLKKGSACSVGVIRVAEVFSLCLDCPPAVFSFAQLTSNKGGVRIISFL